MKRILLSFLFFSSLALISKVNAQCNISNVSIAPTNVDQNTCLVTFNLSYTVAANGGSKYSIVHLWESNAYPNHVATDYPLSSSQTETMLGTIIISDPNTNPQLLPSWPTGSSNFKSSTALLSPILGGGLTVTTNSDGSKTFSFTGLQVSLSSCTQAIKITGDVWATNNSQNASCFSAKAIDVTVNDPVMAGLMNCSDPRAFSVAFKTLTANNITFSAYEDIGNDGVFGQVDRNSVKLNLSGPNISGTTQDVTVSNPANQNTSYGFYTFDRQSLGSKFSIFVVARAAGNNYDNVLWITNSCAPLPVSFKAFTATKGNASTSLKWTTASESNSKGFYVQRFYNGQWTTLGFVATKAENGTSSSELNYTYTDVFNAKGVTQYRIMQTDIDGKAKYSEIRSISNGSQAGNVLVYPNPATVNGNVSIVLANAGSLYDIQIVDAAGRIVKEYNSVRSTQQVSGLSKGQYLARVIERESGQVSVEKFILQ